MSDAMIRSLAENGGVIQINFGSAFLTEAANISSTELWDKVLAPMLLWDAFMVFAVPGVVLASLPRVIQIFTRQDA